MKFRFLWKKVCIFIIVISLLYSTPVMAMADNLSETEPSASALTTETQETEESLSNTVAPKDVNDGTGQAQDNNTQMDPSVPSEIFSQDQSIQEINEQERENLPDAVDEGAGSAGYL